MSTHTHLKNDKEVLFNYANSIKSSNDFSMARLNKGLTLNQMQLLAYAIFNTQQNGITKFNKHEFEKKFDLEKYNTVSARKDSKSLLGLQMSMEDLENDTFEYFNVFQAIRYEKGNFTFKWTDDITPHIIDLKNKYVLTDLTIKAKFRSHFSWVLYDFLLANYGRNYLKLSKQTLLKLFNVEDKKTYVSNTARFKGTVLDVAVEEINTFTELQVELEEHRKGKAIIGFNMIWSIGKRVAKATEEQHEEIRLLFSYLFDNIVKYTTFKNKKNRDNAKEIYETVQQYFEIFSTDFQNFSKEKAEFYTTELKLKTFQLERFTKYDGLKEEIFYNWLDERE